MMSKDSHKERVWVLAWAVAIVVLASVPYFVGINITPGGYHFLGLTHNIDDGAVYLSWMRQAADGHFFIRNLFTNEPQVAQQFNVLFLLMGAFAWLTHIPLIWVFHIFRAVLAAVLLLTVWKFAELFLDKAGQRKLLIPLLGLSAGVGWMIPGARMPTGAVDTWQPEAITFLSIYLNPLFLAGLILMVGTLYYLVVAQRTLRARYALYAGLCALCLGNVHTYDLLTIACVWGAYLVVSALARKLPVRVYMLTVLAAAIAAPSAAYQVHLYLIDSVYRARADTMYASPSVLSFFEGYGLVLIGAVVGAVMSIMAARSGKEESLSQSPKLLLIVWSVVGFVVPYVPVGQQRKLIMGVHIPLCILCAYALYWALVRLPRSVAKLAAFGLVLLTVGSNVQFMSRDVAFLRDGTTAPHYTPFISSSDLSAIRYLRENAGPRETVLAPPGLAVFPPDAVGEAACRPLALFIPALAGRQVYYGHSSETPHFGRKLMQWYEFASPACPGSFRAELVRSEGIFYYVGALSERQSAEAGLRRVYSKRGVAVFRYKL